MKTIFLDRIHIGDSIRKVLAEKDKKRFVACPEHTLQAYFIPPIPLFRKNGTPIIEKKGIVL